MSSSQTEAARAGANLPGRINPVTASVIQGALQNIAVEMGYKLMRMSYSSIIRESEDFGSAIIDADGNQLAESSQSTPLQSGPIPGYVRGAQRIMEERGDAFRPGDVIIHNDAYAGASHGPDVAFIVPVFWQEKLIGFSVTTAHHLDIGALSRPVFDETQGPPRLQGSEHGIENKPVIVAVHPVVHVAEYQHQVH